jgi:hypothetical protein
MKPPPPRWRSKVGPAADQTALLVVEMREIDLQRAFLGGGAAAEDFKNEAGAVDDLGVPFLLEIALLNGRQRMIDDHKARIVFIETALISWILPVPISVAGRGSLTERRGP